jgi:hypothetical protein
VILEDKPHASRLYVLRRAEESGNVSTACCQAGVSRTVFYRCNRRFSMCGCNRDIHEMGYMSPDSQPPQTPYPVFDHRFLLGADNGRRFLVQPKMAAMIVFFKPRLTDRSIHHMPGL